MKVTVHIYGEFRKFVPQPEISLEVAAGSTVKTIQEQLGIPDTIYKMALVNGFRVKENRVVKDGDEIHIFQPVGGG